MDEFKNKLNQQYSGVIECLSLDYKNARTNMIFKCRHHNHKFEEKRCNLIGVRAYKHPCPRCRKEYRETLKFKRNVKDNIEYFTCSKCNKKLKKEYFGKGSTEYGIDTICKNCNNTHDKNRYYNDETRFIQYMVNKTKSKDTNITIDKIYQQLKYQNYKCMYSGCEMLLKPGVFNSCSIERIDETKGYIDRNWILIISILNVSISGLKRDDANCSPAWTFDKIANMYNKIKEKPPFKNDTDIKKFLTDTKQRTEFSRMKETEKLEITNPNIPNKPQKILSRYAYFVKKYKLCGREASQKFKKLSVSEKQMIEDEYSLIKNKYDNEINSWKQLIINCNWDCVKIKCSSCMIYKQFNEMCPTSQSQFIPSKCQKCINNIYNKNKKSWNASRFITKLLNGAKKSNDKRNKKGRNLEFILTKENIIDKCIQQRMRCKISNIPLNFQQLCNWKVSIERINNNIGYTNDNTILICKEFNASQNLHWTCELFQDVFMNNGNRKKAIELQTKWLKEPIKYFDIFDKFLNNEIKYKENERISVNKLYEKFNTKYNPYITKQVFNVKLKAELDKKNIKYNRRLRFGNVRGGYLGITI